MQEQRVVNGWQLLCIIRWCSLTWSFNLLNLDSVSIMHRDEVMHQNVEGRSRKEEWPEEVWCGIHTTSHHALLILFTARLAFLVDHDFAVHSMT